MKKDIYVNHNPNDPKCVFAKIIEVDSENIKIRRWQRYGELLLGDVCFPKKTFNELYRKETEEEVSLFKPTASTDV